MALSKLFISYRSLDSAKVDAIVARLRSLKDEKGQPRYSLWQDKTGITDGQDWWQSIVDAIIGCEVFIFTISQAALQSPVCRAELSYARKRNRPIVPLVLEGEYTYNPITGKNDIAYWNDIPQELHDLRAQFLFYEGTPFLLRLEAALAEFAKAPNKWRDIPADRPRDPRDASDVTNDTATLYDEACDYAGRLEFVAAERLFQKLVNMSDPDFGEEAHEWILILRDYQKIVSFASKESTKHKAQVRWESYRQQFPKSFVKLFDPKNLQSSFAIPSSSASPKPAQAQTSQTSTALPVYTSPKQAVPQQSPAMPRSVSRAEQFALPAPFEWITIPAGEVRLEGKNESYLKETTTFNVPAFAIGKYPVTVEQFWKFTDDKGYMNQKWWTKKGWKWRNQNLRQRANEGPFLGDKTQPATITWYEAMAFCTWLSEMTDYKITLPTEQQWQRAAQGNDQRFYPWGYQLDTRRFNNSIGDTKSQSYTSVQAYENIGDSPYGVVDMVGNAAEWCLTSWRTGDVSGEGEEDLMKIAI